MRPGKHISHPQVLTCAQPEVGKHLQPRSCKRKHTYQEQSRGKCGVKIRTTSSLNRLISFDIIRCVRHNWTVAYKPPSPQFTWKQCATFYNHGQLSYPQYLCPYHSPYGWHVTDIVMQTLAVLLKTFKIIFKIFMVIFLYNDNNMNNNGSKSKINGTKIIWNLGDYFTVKSLEMAISNF